MFSNAGVLVPIGLAIWAIVTMGLYVLGSEWGKKKDKQRRRGRRDAARGGRLRGRSVAGTRENAS